MELSTFGSGGQWGGGREERSLRAPKEIGRKKLGKRRPGQNREERRSEHRKRQTKQDVGNPTKQEGKARATGERQEAKGTEKSRRDGKETGEAGERQPGRGKEDLGKETSAHKRDLRAPVMVRASDPDEHQAGRIHQVGQVSQQVDGREDGHGQSAVPVAHIVGMPVAAAHVRIAAGVASVPLAELVEWPEHDSRGIQKDRKQRQS